MAFLLFLVCGATNVDATALASSSARGGQIASLNATSEPGTEVTIVTGLELTLEGRTRNTGLSLSGRFSRLQLETFDQGFANGTFSLGHEEKLGRTRAFAHDLDVDFDPK